MQQHFLLKILIAYVVCTETATSDPTLLPHPNGKHHEAMLGRKA
jgi:hypothetical protein